MRTESRTRVVVCKVCKSARFWLRQDDRAGTLEIVCQGCGHVLTALAIKPE